MKQFFASMAVAALVVWPVNSQKNSTTEVNSIVIVKGDEQQKYNLYFDSVFAKQAVKPGEIIEIVSKAVTSMPKGNIEQNVVVGMQNNADGDENYFVVTQNSDDKTSDTVVIRLGKKKMMITEQIISNDSIESDTEGDEAESGEVFSDFDEEGHKGSSKLHKKHKTNRFEGHWAAVNLGANMFREADNSLYPTNEAADFMALSHQSREFNLNLFTMSVGLQKNKRNIGLVSGIGFNYNNYFFDNDITIDKNPVTGNIQPVDLIATGYKNVEKTKLTSLYITVPLLLEFQIPVKGNDRIFVNGGVIGAVKVSSHTKIKADGNKDKNFDSFYMNPLRYGFIANAGYNNFGVYATYYKTAFFQADKGPEVYPFTVGLSLFFD